jgi:mycofactocin precursor
MMDRQVAPLTTSEGEAEVDRRPEPVPDADPTGNVVVLDDLLVEEVSIDGMCGVY